MNPRPIEILWMASADAGNTNAQSLNAREVALRLDPEMFRSIFFYDTEPDPRLSRGPATLIRLPEKHRTWTILKELFAGHDLVTYVDYSPASYVFLHSPRRLRRGTLAVMHVEAPIGQLEGASWQLKFLHDGVASKADIHIAITDFVAREMESMGR